MNLMFVFTARWLRYDVFLFAFALTVNVACGSEPVDVIIHNANILRCNVGNDRSEAIAISEGRIAAVGTSEEVLKLKQAGITDVIDAHGATLTPGFVDSHLHFLGLGHSLQMLDLRDATTWEEIIAQVVDAAASVPAGTWIEGRGWHQSKWLESPVENVDGYPDHKSLSELVPDHPVVLTHASGHALFANAAAMKLAGVGPDTSDPAGGEILKDALGRPIGVFRENAGNLIRRAQARAEERLGPEERLSITRQRVRLAGEACLKFGITGVHDAGSSFRDAAILRQMAEAGDLPLRMVLMIRENRQALEQKMPSTRWIDLAEGFLTVRSVKISIDGALGPHGAWLLQPYSDLPNKIGLNTVALDEMDKIAELCKRHNWQLCVHAIGDRANQEVLNSYEKILGSDVTSDHRWRIEHAQHLAPEDIARFGALGVIPAMQANHCTSDAIFVPERLGERRSATGAYMWRSLIDSGAIIPNGTDAPVERVDPRASLYAAVTRQLDNGQAFYPKQCMTREEALLSYTLWPAIAAFQDNDLGSLEVSKRADMVLWDTDLLTCPPERLLEAMPLRVWLAGLEVVQAEAASGK